MNSSGLSRAGLLALTQWYDGERHSDGQDPERYVVCAGLAVLELLRTVFPLEGHDYITERNQVKTSGSLIRKILKRHGETRTYVSEGGRTTRGTVTAAEKLVNRLNGIAEIGAASEENRGSLADALQGWLVVKVQEYFNRQKLKVEIDVSKPAQKIIGDLLAAAGSRGGPVAQHLVGAKLALRYPEVVIDNYSYTTADQQLGRPGDFVVSDTVFHVTMSPMPPVIEKCRDNLRDGFRVVLLVPVSRVQAAAQLAEGLELEPRIGLYSIEHFLGQNIEEMSMFGTAILAIGFRNLLEMYNNRVEVAENDRSLLIEIPTNLG